MQPSSSVGSNSQLSLVRDLNPERDLWNMKARVVRKWIQRYGMELILLDEMGQRIQAGIKKHLIPKFDLQIQEDDVVILSKFGVGINTDKYRVITHDYRVIFYGCTTVERVHGWEGVEYGFVFIPFELITRREANELPSVDVCGTVVHSGDLDIFGEPPKQSKRMMFQLQNEEGSILTCTLWNDYAQEYNNFVTNHPHGEHLMVIVQYGKIKPWKGELQVHSDMFATRVFMNPEIAETNDLRRRLLKNYLDSRSDSSQIVISTQTAYPVRQEFVLDTPRKHVDEITEVQQEMSCVVVATIKIVQERYGWFYAACRTCAKKLLSKSQFLERSENVSEAIMNLPSTSLICPKCNCECTSVTTKFKVQVRAQDETGSVSFVLFDSHVSKIVGVSATDIRERQVQINDTESFPHELSRLVDKKLAFKIEISDYNLKNQYHVYTVLKICDDPVVLADLVVSDDSVVETSQGHLAIEAVDLGESSEHVVTPSSKVVVSVMADSSAVTSENQSSGSSCGKRSSSDNSLVNHVADLNSSTKRSRKKPSKLLS